jgi:translation initiation factor 6
MTTPTLDLMDTPIIGVFATCTEDFALVPCGIKASSKDFIADHLHVQVLDVIMSQSSVIGSMIRGNSNGFLIPRGSSIEGLEGIDLHVSSLPDKLNAVGNIVLANDSVALVHPELSDHSVDIIAQTLKVEVHRGTIAGLKTVGMAGAVTNKGLLVNPKATAQELAFLEKIFDLPVDVGTTNFGTPMVGSGLLANSKGYVAGSKTTGYELGRIESALGFIVQE